MNAPPGWDSETSGEDESDGEVPPPPRPKPAQFSWKRMIETEPSTKTKVSTDDSESRKTGFLGRHLNVTGKLRKKKDKDKGKGKATAHGESEPEDIEVQDEPIEAVKKRVRIFAHDEPIPPSESLSVQLNKDTSQVSVVDCKPSSVPPVRDQAADEMLSILRRLVVQNITQSAISSNGKEIIPESSSPSPTPQHSSNPLPKPNNGEASSAPSTSDSSSRAQQSIPDSTAHLPNPFSPISPSPKAVVHTSKTLPPNGLPYLRPSLSRNQEQGPRANVNASAHPGGVMPPPMYPHPAALQPWHPSEGRAATAQGQGPGVPPGSSALRSFPSSEAQPDRSIQRGNDTASGSAMTPSDSGNSIINKTEDHWSAALINAAACFKIGHALYNDFKSQHGEGTNMLLRKALAKELAAKRSVSQAITNVFGDASATAGHELSNHLKQAVRFIVRNELFRDTDRLQGLITHLLPKSDTKLGSWLNPRIAQVLLITAQQWVEKQLDVNGALKATSQLKQNTQNPGAQTGLLDHFHASLKQQLRESSAPARTHPSPSLIPSLPQHPSSNVDPPDSAASNTSHTSYASSESQYSCPSTAPESSSRSSRLPKAALLPLPLAPAPPLSRLPTPSPCASPSPPDSPGTLASDDEADKQLGVADSGPMGWKTASRRQADEKRAGGERRTRSSKEQIEAAKEVMYLNRI